MKRAEEGMVMNAQHMRGTGHGCPLLKICSKSTGRPFAEPAYGSSMTQMSHQFIALVRAYYAMPDP